MEITCKHLTGERGVTAKIKEAMQEAAKQFVYIGFLLWEVKEYKYYNELNYESVYEYAENELGFKRSSTKNFIAICETFCRRDQHYKELPTMFLEDRWSDYQYSQLTEMLAMSPAQRQETKPNMSVRQLRDIKKAPTIIDADPRDIEIDFETLDKIIDRGQTSGQQTIQVHNGMEETNIGKPLVQVGLPVDNKQNASLKEETLQNLCEIACMKFNKKKRYHIVIYAEK